MKTDIHPRYHPNATVTCACGNTLTVGSTQSEIRVEICAACHPFYSGEKRLVDTGGRVERFARIAEKSAKVKASLADQKSAPRKKKKLEVLSERQWKKLA